MILDRLLILLIIIYIAICLASYIRLNAKINIKNIIFILLMPFILLVVILLTTNICSRDKNCNLLTAIRLYLKTFILILKISPILLSIIINSYISLIEYMQTHSEPTNFKNFNSVKNSSCMILKQIKKQTTCYQN